MPVTYQGYDSTQWERIINTTLAEHRREMAENMLRNYAFGALLESNGRVTYGHSGNGFDWPVQFKVPPVSGNTGEQTRNFVRRNYWKVANLPWRGYETTDAVSRKEFLANRGDAAIVKIFDQMEDNLKRGLRQHFGTQYYVDGSASGNETCWHGFESMFGRTSNTTLDVTSTGFTTRTANQADYVCDPSDTYAGIQTDLGQYGGSGDSSVAWPFGTTDVHGDFWSPLIIVFDSSKYSATDDTFDKGHEAIRFGLIHSDRNGGMDSKITNVVLDRELFRALKTSQGAKEEIQVDNASQGMVRKLGFPDSFIFDGREVFMEHGVPTRVGYGFNYNGIELAAMDDELLHVETEYDMRSQSYNAVVSTLSNLCFRSGPRNVFKLLEFDTAGT